MQLMTDNSTKTLINLTKQIYNGLTQAIEDGDTKEASERLKQDDVISAKVTAETDARIQADSDEAGTRQAKDAELQTAIETEATERKGADTSLQANIDKEATTRANADTEINTKLDPIISSLNSMFSRMPYSKGQTGVPVEIGYDFFTSQALVEYGAKENTFDDNLLQAFLKKIWVVLNEKGYSNYCRPHGLLQPYGTGFFWGLISMFSSSAPKEDKGLPQSSQFYFYYPNTRKTYVFGTYNYTYFKYELADTDTVNTLISNAKTALETEYKNADTQLQTDITTAYQQADTNLSNTLTQAYTDADTALRKELEGKINAGQIVTTTDITASNIIRSTLFAFSSSEKTRTGLVSSTDFSISYAAFSNGAYIEKNMYLNLQRDSETTSSSFVGRFSYIGNTPVYFAASNFNLVDTNGNISVFHPIFEVYDYYEIKNSYGYTTISFVLIYNRQFKVWSSNMYTYETPVIACRTAESLKITKKVSLNKLAFN